ncbi:MAG: GNAT family N-acetyltransferase [Pseudomonadota bacterium]
MNRKPIILHAYNSIWPELFIAEAELIRNALADHVIDLHHIGSTSVPGLAAKEDIDICLVSDDLKNSLALTEIGYIFKGELNIPLRTFFSKNSDISKVNLHVVEQGHHFLALNLCFRNTLCTNDSVRIAYQDLKTRLTNDPVNFERVAGRFPRYTLEKHNFINDVLDAAGYEALSVVRCTHYREWDAYHRIRNEQIFAPINVKYDPNHLTISDANHHHFVCMHGTKIVSVAHVEFLNNHEAALRSLATDEPFKCKGYGRHLMKLLERWLTHHDRTVL